MIQQVWFITGASSGLGKATAENALVANHKVVAAVRNPADLDDLKAQFPSDQLLIVKVDVTKQEDIDKAFADGRSQFGRIDIVLNNAGTSIIGEVEGTPDNLARDLFEVIFWGTSNVSRTALQYFRENSPIGGRLLQISSNIAFEGVAGAAYYCAAKAALEALSESLSKEVDPAWNIKVTIIEPGPFDTRMAKDTPLLPAHPAYTNPDLATNILRKMYTSIPFDGDSKKAAKAFLKLAALDEPPLRLPLHRYALVAARGKAQSLNDASDKWESWSEDLYLDAA